jgi:Meiotically up-regulated gene 113
MEYSPAFCQFDDCTREILPGSRYCRFCQRKGSERDYREQALAHKQAIKARCERESAAPEPWKLLLGYCQPYDEVERYGRTYTYAIGIHKYVKFGQALSVDGRLMTLQIANPRRLRVLGKISSSRELEHHLHHSLRDHCHRGEWFKLDDTTREFIRLMNANDLVGICKRMSVLMTQKHGICLVEAFSARMYHYEQGTVIV